jgi:hypothetical protein
MDPANPLKVVKTHWQVGDQREVPAQALEALHGTDAYDSYERLYRIDGRAWRLAGRVSRADGPAVCLLRCVNE